MKKSELIKKSAAALIIAAISFTGCDKENDGDLAKGSSIILTTAMKGEVVIQSASTCTTIIYWSDGSDPKTVTLSAPTPSGIFSDSHEYIHAFSGTTSRTIVIERKNITHLGCFFRK